MKIFNLQNKPYYNKNDEKFHSTYNVAIKYPDTPQELITNINEGFIVRIDSKFAQDMNNILRILDIKHWIKFQNEIGLCEIVPL